MREIQELNAEGKPQPPLGSQVVSDFPEILTKSRGMSFKDVLKSVEVPESQIFL
jgi:hypothetical protein